MDKPKRPLSSYMLWLNSSRESIKAEHPGLRVTEIAKKGGEMWQSMQDKDKSFWEEKAARAKEQYVMELESYNSNGGAGLTGNNDCEVAAKQSNNSGRMTDKPKRPMSAYILWLNSVRESIKAKYPGLKVTEVAKKGGEMWRSMKDKDKSIWEEKAARAKEQYAKDLESYDANR